MSRIVFYLSGPWSSSFLPLLNEKDILLCAPGLKPQGPRKFKELSSVLTDQSAERDIASWLTSINSGGDFPRARELVDCFLNDFYSYSLKPLLALLIELKGQIEKFEPVEVLVITAKSSGQGLPMYGFQTSESLRGSPYLLNSRLAKYLQLSFPAVEFKFHYTKGDFFCNEKCRSLLIGGANLVFGVAFAVKVLWFSRFVTQREGKSCGNVVVARTGQQLSFANQIFVGSDVALAIFPQISQGIFRGWGDAAAEARPGVVKLGVSFKSMQKARAQSRADVAELMNFSRQSNTEVLRIKGLDFLVNLADISREICLVSSVLLYKNMLAEVLLANGATRLVNFELVGRMAGLEALAARKNKISSCSIQTALISAAPHPIFPYSDRFYVDSASTLPMILKNGSKKLGDVLYAGAPYLVSSTRGFRQLKKIAFFTQPYEYQVTKEIISLLCRLLRAENGILSLRVHPRDRRERYFDLMENFPDVLKWDDNNRSAETIKEQDLCVTRTSSVAKEAIAMGSPILLCLWTSFDRSVKADYIVDFEEKNKYCSYGDEDLPFVLKDFTGLATSGEKLASVMFAGKTMTDLASACLN
jgi:hypothetical protein